VEEEKEEEEEEGRDGKNVEARQVCERFAREKYNSAEGKGSRGNHE